MRVHLSVAEARALGEGAMRGAGYDAEEARILADHVLDAPRPAAPGRRSAPTRSPSASRWRVTRW